MLDKILSNMKKMKAGISIESQEKLNLRQNFAEGIADSTIEEGKAIAQFAIQLGLDKNLPTPEFEDYYCEAVVGDL